MICLSFLHSNLQDKLLITIYNSTLHPPNSLKASIHLIHLPCSGYPLMVWRSLSASPSEISRSLYRACSYRSVKARAWFWV